MPKLSRLEDRSFRDAEFLATRTLRHAYEAALLLERLVGNEPYEFAARAVSSSLVGMCQAVLCVAARLDEATEHGPVADLLQRLEALEAAFLGQRSNNGRLAAGELSRACGMLRRIDEVDFEAWAAVGRWGNPAALTA